MIRDFHKSNVKCMIHCTIEVIKFNGGNDKDGASFFLCFDNWVFEQSWDIVLVAP